MLEWIYRATYIDIRDLEAITIGRKKTLRYYAANLSN